MPGISVNALRLARTVLPEDATMTMPSPQYQPAPQRASFNQRGKDRMVARAQQIVGPALEPGEQVLVGLRVHTGPSNWWLMVRSLRLVVRLAQRHYFMVTTDRRVILCNVSYWTGRPTKIKTAIPRSVVRVAEYDPAAYYPSFVLQYPEASTKLRTRGMWLNELHYTMNLIGAPGPVPQGAGAPGYPPGPGMAPPPAGYQPGPPQHQAPPAGYQPTAPQYQAPPPGYQPQGQVPPPGYQPPGQVPPPPPGPGRHAGPRR